MPKYELMYLLGSQVVDTEVPTITSQVLKFVEDFGGTEIKEEQLGKKKLAYPIGKTRNGYYVVVNFTMDGKKVNLFDAKIRTQDQNIIRYILINLDEHLKRLEKDKVEQAKLSKRTPEEEAVVVEKKPKKSSMKTKEPKTAPTPVLEMDSTQLDKKIDEVLSEDLTK
jgi:small subunit ribosomal protein S6